MVPFSPIFKNIFKGNEIPESAPGHQVFKIKTEWSEYQTQGTCLLDRVLFRSKALLEQTLIIDG